MTTPAGFITKDGKPILQMARIGTMSEYAVVPKQSLIKIDTRYRLDKAALVGTLCRDD